MKTLYFFTIVGILGLFSCTKERNEVNAYLIFGHFYGECIGDDCVANFKIEDGKIYEDANDSYNGSLPFDFVQLSDETYALTKVLINDIPADLLDKEDQTFGCPDCVDQGGLYIEYGVDDNISKWSIDQNKSAVPEEFHVYMDLVNDKIALLLE